VEIASGRYFMSIIYRVVVSVSRRTNVSSRSSLKKNCQRLGLGRQTSRSLLGLSHLRLVPKTYNLTVSWWACRWRRTQCERALDVVSLCCTIAHHINILKQWTWMVTSGPVIATNVSSRSRLGWWSQRLGLFSVSSFYVSCPSLFIYLFKLFTVAYKWQSVVSYKVRVHSESNRVAA